MNIKELIKDKTCYIVSNELKKEILSYVTNNKLLLDIHFFDINEVTKKIYFRYDNRAIYNVSKHFNVSFSNAKMLIDNLYYLMYSNEVVDDKIQFLKQVKDYLDRLDLLKYDYDFIKYLNSYDIISDLSLDNAFLYKINQLLDKKIEFIKQDEKNDVNVYKFNDSDEEVTHLANSIGDLLVKGINPDNIHILNYSSDYLPYIDKIFSLYNIPYNIPSSNYLYDINQIKELYMDYISDVELSKTKENYNAFINIVNSLSFIDDINEKREFLLYILKNTKESNKEYKNCINFSSSNTVYLDNNYYFFIGLNNKVYPNYKKDEDYLGDDLKKKLGYITSVDANVFTREYATNHLKSKNLSISYRENDYFNSYLKSDLLDSIKPNIINIELKNEYSSNYDRLLMAKELDSYYKYNNKSDLLDLLLTRVNKKDYSTYNNSYNSINKDIYFDKIINNKISISYSSFEKFNNCNYGYYLDSILKENDTTFYTYLGNLFHHVLEKIYDSDFNFDDAIASYKSDYELNEKEKVLLNNLIEDFKIKIKIILDQYKNSNFKNVIKEKKISIKDKTDCLIDINGRIDKIMMDNENNAYIVDYKTSNTKLTLDYIEYGLRCQLPFYFYLLSKSKEYADKFLVGCYLQNLNFDFITSTNKDNSPLLNGYTYNDESIVEKIDNCYKDKSFIKGIKPTKNGLGTYAKTFDANTFNNIINVMDTNINNMINDIKEVSFNINPKLFKNKSTTCKNCNYKDICYKKFKDYISIRKVNDDGLDG